MPDTRPLVIGLGELLWDVFPDSRRPGGAPANVAYQAQQLGCRGLVASRIGRDGPGNEILEYLERKGLDVSTVQIDRDHPTGRVTVDISDPHHPTYTIHENVAWDYLQFDDTLKHAVQDAAAVCFGTLAQRSPVSREAIRNALAATSDDCLIVYDVNLRQRYWSADTINASLDAASIAKLNHEEAATLADILNIPGDRLTGFAAELRRRYALNAVCITRAEAGCLLVGENETADIAGHRVDVVDAVGSGDAFTAGLIVALLEDWPLHSAAQFANEIGALVATQRGAMPDLANRFHKLREKHAPR
mgnify:FL=1